MKWRIRPALAGKAFACVLAASIVLAAGAAALAPAAPDAPKQPGPPQDGIALAPAGAAAVATPSAPDAWGGQRTGAEPTLSNRVVDYRIEATLDPDRHTVTGSQQLTWRNRSDVSVHSVYLHLYMNAFQNADSTFFTEMRTREARFRSGVDTKDGEWGNIALRSVRQGAAAVPWRFVQPDGGPATDQTVVRLDLPQPVAPGASTMLDIGFITQLPRVVARTGYFGSFHLVAQWFPKIAVLELPGERGALAPRWNAHEFHLHSEFFADFGSFDVKLTVPKGYTVGATGELQGAPVEKDGLVTHHYVQGDVHDFAWTADNRSGPPLEDTWTGPGSPQVRIKVLYPPEYAASAKRALKTTRDALAWFSKTLGPYPYKTVTVVIPPFNAGEAGGMEYPTFFTSLGYDKVDPNTTSEFALDLVTIHEFGHGYFYGILASNEFEEPMLDEGLNEYWNARMVRERGQDVHATTPLLKALGFAPAFDFFQVERLGSGRGDPADPLGQNAYDRLQGIGPVYSRTAIMMRDLEERIGRQAMERGFKEYYRRWKFRHPGIADFRETLAEATGQRAAVEEVFAQHVYKAGKVDDRIARFTSEEELPQPGIGRTEEQLAKQVEQTRDNWKKAHPDAKEGTGPYPFRTTVTLRRDGVAVPQELLVKFADGTVEAVRWNGDEKWRSFSWVKPARAVSAELDPQRRHYLDTSKLDDSRTIERDGSASRRWTSDFAALVQLILSMIATV